MNVNSLKRNEADFPKLLENIPSPPKELFWTGSHPKEWLDKPKVAIVGSRKITAYGRYVTEKFASELSRAGIVIISGLAFGVDILAHKASLDAGGITVAVLPSSVDKIYPASHENIAQRITQKGTLITEYRSGERIYASNFIARNRLISGFCDALLITEAALKSGSLHTARFALEQGKTVLTVPGNINNPMSEGCNNLIKSGAIPVTTVDDIFFNLGYTQHTTSKTNNFTGSSQEKIIFDLINQGICSQDDIAMAAKVDGSILASALTTLEISGYIRPAGGGNWVAA